MDDNPSPPDPAVAIDHALVLGEILGYVAAERAEQIRRALAAGLHEDQLAAALGAEQVPGDRPAQPGAGGEAKRPRPPSRLIPKSQTWPTKYKI